MPMLTPITPRSHDESAAAPLLDVSTLYRRHITLVLRRLRRLLGDDVTVQGLAEEAFVKLLEHTSGRGTQEEICAFLYRSATNLGLNQLREGLRQRELRRLRAPRGAPPAARDAMEPLREVLAQVSYDEAQVAAYHHVDGLTSAEIALLLGVEERTVIKRIQAFDTRAARMLRHLQVRHVA